MEEPNAMTHKWKRWLAPGAAITAAAVLAACSSSSSSSSSSTQARSPAASSSASASTGGDDAGLAKAQQMVSQFESVTTTYPVPTASIKGAARLQGKTVYYIPLGA